MLQTIKFMYRVGKVLVGREYEEGVGYGRWVACGPHLRTFHGSKREAMRAADSRF